MAVRHYNSACRLDATFQPPPFAMLSFANSRIVFEMIQVFEVGLEEEPVMIEHDKHKVYMTDNIGKFGRDMRSTFHSTLLSMNSMIKANYEAYF